MAHATQQGTKHDGRARHWALSKDIGYADQPKDFDWLQKNIPCQAACPAGTDIPEYLAAISRGEFATAYRINLRDNVFPAVLGRVCSRPCEPACRHGWEGLGEPVAICFSKRSAADFMKQDPIALPRLFPPSGKTVAIVGSGVAGLAAARDLSLFGHKVTVFEKHWRPGGMLNQGIPEFRLPRNIIDREIEQVRLAGVTIVCNTVVGKDVALAKLVDEYNAVILAAGTLRPNVLQLPGSTLKGISHGLDFLLCVNDTGGSAINGDVVVIGGGFTAMDCARSALRLQAQSVRVYYRRSRQEMLVTEEELVELEHEGIPVEYLANPAAYAGNGAIQTIQFTRTSLGDPDASGRRRPMEVPGSAFDVPATAVLLATGQFPETSWIDDPLRTQLVGGDNWLRSGRSVTTGHERIFVAGDFALGATTLIDAIGHAKKCAREVDRRLMGKDRLVDIALIEAVKGNDRDPKANEIRRFTMPTIPLEERSLTAEVESGYLRREATQEALRCYLCHYKYEIDNDLCIYCDGCLRVKPVENCIVKVSSLNYDEQGRITGYNRSTSSMDYNLLYIDQNECIRCGACVDICPVECISVQKVSLKTLPAAGTAEKLCGEV